MGLSMCWECYKRLFFVFVHWGLGSGGAVGAGVDPALQMPAPLSPGPAPRLAYFWGRGEVKAGTGREEGGLIRLTLLKMLFPGRWEQSDPDPCVLSGFQPLGGCFSPQPLASPASHPRAAVWRMF